MSKIEWTGESWNPISGCSRKSTGCENCYAEVMTKRLAAMGLEKYQGLLNEQNRFNGVVKFDEKALMKPLKKKKPTTYFVNSMSDLFHENVKDEWIDKVFAVMALCHWHRFQILTKRPERMKDYFDKIDVAENSFQHRWSDPIADFGLTRTGNADDDDSDAVSCDVFNYLDENYPLPNVWLGVSVENQEQADKRIPLLLETPAAVRFLSCEPLLSPIRFRDVPGFNLSGSHGQDILSNFWIIVGGESGAGARRCDEENIRDIVQQCKRSGVPVFVKQMGKESYYKGVKQTTYSCQKGGNIEEFPTDLRIRELPK